MRRALLLTLAIAFALACGDDLTEPTTAGTQPGVTGTTAVTGGPLFATTTTEDGLSISTDKDDYQPGDVVHLTGSGWQPGDVLDIVLTDDPLTHDPHTWSVSVDEQGMFHDQTYVVDEGDLNVSFTLVATSRATGRSLTVNFTDSQPTQVRVTPTPQSVSPGGSASYTVDVTMGGNSTACNVTLSVTGLITGVTGGFSGGANPVTTNANFSRTLTLNTTAAVPASTVNFTVQATPSGCQGGSSPATGSGILNVLGPATKLVFSQQPSNTISTRPITPAVTVQVQDAADHLITTSSAPVTLAIGNNPGTGTLSGTLTQNAVNGLATFSDLSIDKAGTGYTLTASSGGLTGATSSAFAITVGAFSKLAFTTQPGGATAGVAFTQQPVVTVQDFGGNTITSGQGSGASITLSIHTNPSSGTLTCTNNTVTATNGVAAFAGCRINNAGSGYRLGSASNVAGNTLAANSDLFNVVANNQPPVLAAIGNKSIAEETQLSFTATATDENVASLQFSLANPATGAFPTGADITAAGAFTWTPSEAQGPGVYRVKVVVTDNATLTDEEEIQITVSEVNKAPQVTAIPDKSVNEEAALTFTAAATDADLPANSLTFSLQAGTDPVPSGASINGSTGVFTWTPTEAQGPGVYEFKVRATDDGTPVLFGEANVKITVNEVNQAPVLEAIGNKSVDEGSALTFTAKAADPDVPTNTLSFSLDGAPAGASINATTGAFSWTPADDEPTGTPSDDKTFKVIVKDNGTPQLSDEETITVTVNNVGPVVTVEPDKTGKEGEVISLKGEFKDPGADDHTWSWEYVEGFNAGATCSITGATTTLTPTISCTDDGVVKVTLTVRDDDTGEGSDYLLLTLSNVAPSATSLNAPTEVNEGTAINLKLDGVTDPSSVDATSLQYSFDCGDGNGYSAFGSSNSASCPTTDNGVRNVGGRVKDKDNGVSDNYSATVTVKNVPPVANAGGPYSGTEGSPISLSGSATDVGTDDVISYAWTINSSAIDGGGTCSFNGTANQQNAQVTCTDDSNGGQFTASLIATDDDGGASVASTAQVTVTNVAPQIATFTKADLTSSALPSTIIIGGTLNFRATFSDVGSNDSHKGQIDCGTGTYGSATASSSPYEPSCTFSSIGQKVIRVKVSDDDYGSAEVTHTVTVMYNFVGFSSPVDRPNIMNVSKAGQAIPLKWRLTDALGRPITDVTSVSVQAATMTCDQGTTQDQIEEYAAGASGLQNLGDGYYQFNWKTPSTYAGSCKTIALAFGAGALGYTEKPTAYFTFKK